jgi:flavin reductase (DIM6/NTAB) family NADH-FMN oxidoreductase RutF
MAESSGEHFDGAAFRQTMGNFCSGIVIVTANFEGAPVGFAAQSFVSLSLAPPLVAFCPGKTSSSWPKIRASGGFCINILAANQAVEWRDGLLGAPILAGVLAHIECDLDAEHDAGDHTIAVGRVRHFESSQGQAQGEPLLYFRSQYGAFSAFT